MQSHTNAPAIGGTAPRHTKAQSQTLQQFA